ncbi:hypothetical protein VOLCADRAFT_93687 [Volvox carteri f. nagariensis]|uniref:Uncharacterized protein n=1 Tax=Volvox carteri f. nagariensis TaxID=3068 RepID=D8U2S5_VOLCA|nr:uncharacterized protein VOLCADRAFT_93687 [Volvox carteri f. nagariensis]EFJ45951.1 hypothetical protein VOLCADRAFT_93687 [Volvox carteri f. nagariensis]|eukprot:XP_002953029.1 hypothetical protein VOLCADRAFT_93687 [Volvox carteri f. nagariensis]
MIREAIEGALRTNGKFTGEAIVRTPYKPGGGGGKVAGKVTFLVSPIEVAQEVMDQAQRDAEELSRRTVHPALVQAQGRRFQSLDVLGLGPGGAGRLKSDGEGEEDGEEAGRGFSRKGSRRLGRGGDGKFLHDFRLDEAETAATAAAAADNTVSAAWRRGGPSPAPKYRYLVVSDPRVNNESDHDPSDEDAELAVTAPAAGGPQEEISDGEETVEEGEEEAEPVRRQQYDYRLRLDPAKSVGGMAGALLQALSRHLVVLSEVVGPDDLYQAVKVVATARGFLQQQQQQQRSREPQSATADGDGAANVGGRYGTQLGALRQPPQQQRGGKGVMKSLKDKPEPEPASGGELALQVLLPKQPYIRSGGYGSKYGSSGGNGNPSGDMERQRVWRLYSHRVPIVALAGVVPASEAHVRLYVNRTTDARELADRLGPAVVREGQVVLLAAGRDALVVALAAVVRTRSWLAATSNNATPMTATAVATGGFGADLDVAVYPSWCGGAEGGEGTTGPPGGREGKDGGGDVFRMLELLVRLCRGCRPDVRVMGTDELLPPVA